jgi:hypothetical protein
MNFKKCRQCLSLKEVDKQNYRQLKYPSGKYYFKSVCRRCESINTIAYNKKNPRTLEQKEKNKIYTKEWKLKNKFSQNIKYQEKIKNNLFFRLRKNISRSIYHALKKNGFAKNSTLDQYLEWNIRDLKIHLEKQFDAQMTWSNYGRYWHIDHILPQSSFYYESVKDENFKKCWALDNLRPLDAKTNMSEGASRVRHKEIL